MQQQLYKNKIKLYARSITRENNVEIRLEENEKATQKKYTILKWFSDKF